VKNKNLEKYGVEDLAEVSEKTFSSYDEDPRADEDRYSYYEHEISSHFPQQSQQFPDQQVCYHLRGVLSHVVCCYMCGVLSHMGCAVTCVVCCHMCGVLSQMWCAITYMVCYLSCYIRHQSALLLH